MLRCGTCGNPSTSCKTYASSTTCTKTYNCSTHTTSRASLIALICRCHRSKLDRTVRTRTRWTFSLVATTIQCMSFKRTISTARRRIWIWTLKFMTRIQKWSTIICRTWKELQIRYRWRLQSCTRVKRTAIIISRTTWLTSIQRCCTPSITRLTRTRSLEAISSVFIYLARVSSPMRMSIFRSSQRRFEPFKDMFSDETVNHLPFDSKSALCENESIKNALKSCYR